MIDPFVLLAPILLLGVIALVGFVGCDWVFQLERDPPNPPKNIRVVAGDRRVTLSWDPQISADRFEIDRQEGEPGVVPDSYTPLDTVREEELPTIDGSLTYFDENNVTNVVTYHYVIRAANPEEISKNSEDIEATPMSPFGPFVEKFMEGTAVAPGNGWNGMAIRVGSTPIKVFKLGRAFELGMNNTHQMRLVDDATKADIGTTTVNMASETVERFKYGDLEQGGVTLEPGGLYYVLSEETSGGDQLWEQDTILLKVRMEATVPNAVYSTAPGLFVPVGSQGHAYGPVSVMY